jgi:hypothetical protein
MFLSPGTGVGVVGHPAQIPHANDQIDRRDASRSLDLALEFTMPVQATNDFRSAGAAQP